MQRIHAWGAAVTADAKVLLLVALLAVTAGVVFPADRLLRPRDVSAAGKRFQHAAGGLGMGATVCPRWCFVNFDPRIERCTCMEQPLAGGYCYCPEHSGTVSFFSMSRSSRHPGNAMLPDRSTIQPGTDR